MAVGITHTTVATDPQIPRLDHTHWNANHAISVPDGKIIVGNGLGVGTDVTMSGHVTMTNAGVTTVSIPSSAVTDLYSNLVYRRAEVAPGANVNIASAPTSYDGTSLSVGQLVLLTAQSTPSQNGLYVFNGIGVALTRATNYNTDATIRGTCVWIRNGTSNIGKVYQNTNQSTITVGSTAITYSPEIDAGTGLGIVGRTLSMLPTGVSSGTWGATNQTLVGTVNTTGQWTSLGAYYISISHAQVYDFSAGVAMYAKPTTRGKIRALASAQYN